MQNSDFPQLYVSSQLNRVITPKHSELDVTNQLDAMTRGKNDDKGKRRPLVTTSSSISSLCWNLLIRPLASRMCFGKQTVAPSIKLQRKACYDIRQPFSCYYTFNHFKQFSLNMDIIMQNKSLLPRCCSMLFCFDVARLFCCWEVLSRTGIY